LDRFASPSSEHTLAPERPDHGLSHAVTAPASSPNQPSNHVISWRLPAFAAAAEGRGVRRPHRWLCARLRRNRPGLGYFAGGRSKGLMVWCLNGQSGGVRWSSCDYVSPVPEGFQAPEITHKIIDRLRTVNLPVKGVPRIRQLLRSRVTSASNLTPTFTITDAARFLHRQLA